MQGRSEGGELCLEAFVAILVRDAGGLGQAGAYLEREGRGTKGST